LETNQACVAAEGILDLPEAMITYQDVNDRLQKLLEAIEYWAKQQYFFHYSRDMGKLYFAIDKDWKGVLAQTGFPSLRREIEAGIDCYALENYAGCIFHMLRIAETGLRALASERGVKTVRGNKPIEYAMWGEVIGALRDEIDALRIAKGNKKPLTVKKRENREIAVEFYSTIMGDMQALLPLRDRNSHLRDRNDKGEACTAISRTREMMTVMATKLGEASKGKISGAYQPVDKVHSSEETHYISEPKPNQTARYCVRECYNRLRQRAAMIPSLACHNM
jgi:hypothetical protein